MQGLRYTIFDVCFELTSYLEEFWGSVAMDNSNENSEMETIDVRSYILSPELSKFHHLYAKHADVLNKNIQYLDVLTANSRIDYYMITTGLNDSDNPLAPVKFYDREIEHDALIDLISRTRTTYMYAWILGSEHASKGKDLREGQGLWKVKEGGETSIIDPDLLQIMHFCLSSIKEKLILLGKNGDINIAQFLNLLETFLKTIHAGIAYMFMLGFAYWGEENG